jgi:hypothetical protein
MVPLKNHRERIGITGLKVPHYALITEHKEFGIRRAVVAIAGTNSWKTHGYVAARIYHMNEREITQEIIFLEWDKMPFQAVYDNWGLDAMATPPAFQSVSIK